MFVVGALLVLVLLKAAVDGEGSAGKWLRGLRAVSREEARCPAGVTKLKSGCVESSACLTPNARSQPGGDWRGLGETEAPAGSPPLAPGPPTEEIDWSFPSVFPQAAVANLEECV